jgi:hypothetical protein
MNKAEFKKWYGEARATAKEEAKTYWLRYGDCQEVNVPMLLPLEAASREKLAFIPLGDLLCEVVVDEKGKAVHIKSGDNWRHFTIKVARNNKPKERNG